MIYIEELGLKLFFITVTVRRYFEFGFINFNRFSGTFIRKNFELWADFPFIVVFKRVKYASVVFKVFTPFSAFKAFSTFRLFIAFTPFKMFIFSQKRTPLFIFDGLAIIIFSTFKQFVSFSH